MSTAEGIPLSARLEFLEKSTFGAGYVVYNSTWSEEDKIFNSNFIAPFPPAKYCVHYLCTLILEIHIFKDKFVVLDIN